MAKDWIKKAVNPKHKGFCTPMTKSTCTPRRKAFAMTMKKHHGFHKKEDGGYVASDNIDIEGYTNPLKYFAAMGINIPTSWDNYRTKLNSKEESKFLKWRSTLPENLQNENDYDLRGYYKEYGNKPIPKGIEPHLTDEFKLPNHPTFSENSRYYNDETNYLGGKWDNGLYQWKYTPNSEFKNEVIEKKNFDELRNDFILNNHNILSRNPNIFKKYGGYIENDCLECGGKIKYPFGGYAEMGYDVPEYYSAINNGRPRDSATSYNQDVKGKFNWSNTLSKIPIEQIQKDIDSIPLTKNYMLNKTPKGYFNVYDKNNKPLGYSIDGKTLVPQEPNFEDGGLVKAWIQKFIKGGYIADEGFPYKTQSQITPAVEFNQGQTNSFFWNLNNQKVDSPYSNYKQFYVDPNQANTELDYNVVKKVTGNNIPMNNIPGKIDPTMILGSIGAAGDAITQGGSAIASMAGDETSAKALQKAGAIGKVAESFGNIVPIPGVGKALGAVTSIFAAPFTAWGEKIAKNEINKAEQQVNFFNRNTPGIWQPSYYGQTYSKYGSNIKNLEQRIMDDIYSDFDKYMKLT